MTVQSAIPATEPVPLPPIRRAIVRWGRRAAAGFLGLVVLAAGSGMAYQQVSTASDARDYPPTGRMVRVGDHVLRLDCVGSGRPVVILESGLGAPSDVWAWVQRDVAPVTTVCAYDRAGLGYSQPVAGSRDAATEAGDLHRLLGAAGIPSPIVLAGHSYGGLLSRLFVHRYPADVAGLVLVDSAHEDMGERFPPAVAKAFKQQLGGFAILRVMNVFGVPRLLGITRGFAAGLPAPAAGRLIARESRVDFMAAAAREAAAWGESAREARDVKTFDRLPLTVLMSDTWPSVMIPSWRAMQMELASRSTASRFVVVHGSDHAGMNQNARFAGQTAGAIIDMAVRVRRNAH